MDLDPLVPSSDPAEYQEWLSAQPDYWAAPASPKVLSSPPPATAQVILSRSASPIEEDSQALPPPINLEPLPASPSPVSSSPVAPKSPKSQTRTRQRSPSPVASTSNVTLDSSPVQDESLHLRPAQDPLVIPASPPPAATSAAPVQPTSASPQQTSYTRSFRQRKPGQLNPYSLEQARYKAVLEKQDWEDAVVPLKRSHEFTAEELARRKEEIKKRGADNLEGWLVLEDGMRVRKEEWHEGLAPVARSTSSKKRHRRNYSDAETRLQRALQGYSSDSSQASSFDEAHSQSSEDDDPRDIPRERTTPQRRRPHNSKAKKARTSTTVSSSAARHPDSVIEIQDDGSSSPLPIGRHSSASKGGKPPQPRRTIDIDESDQELEQEEEALSSEDEKEMRAVKEDRFALKGRKKRFLRGMMPAVFMRKAERDLELMRKEQRSGRHVDYGGSGDEEETAVDLDEERRGEARRRKAYYEDGDGGLKYDQDPDSPDEEHYAEASWLAAAAPKRKPSSSRAAFGPLPAQTNRQKQTRDMIDRLLVQSRAAQEKQHRRKRRQTKKNSRPITHRKESDYSTTASKPPQVSLADEDELWEAPTFLAPALAPATADDIARPQVPQQQIKTKKQTRKEDDAWKTFRKFSHDFQIERLDPLALPALSPDSVVTKGQLSDLISLLGDGQQTTIRTTFPFSIPLHDGLSEEAVEGLLPSITDSIIEAASTWIKASDEERASRPRPAQEACDALYFLGLYASSKASPHILHLIQAQLDALDRRCRSLSEGDQGQQAALNYFLLTIHWVCLELSLRLRLAAIQRDMEASLFSSPTTRTQRLIKALVQHGPNTTGKALKSNAPDLSVETWAALVNLALSAITTAPLELELPTSESLWEHLISELDGKAEASKTHPVMASEALCYASMLLCALSQISPTGHVTSEPRLSAHWPILARSLEPVAVADLAELDRWSSTELHRRDGYLWSLFARTLVMVDRWKWTLTERDGILAKLYDILNARQLDNLAIDRGAKDFPAFLQHFDGIVGTTLEGREDSAFHIFLKLLVSVAQVIMSAPNEADARRTLNRVLMRVSPMRKLPPNSSRSMLVNHYSLFITLTIVAPWSAPQRLSQVRALLSFEAADQDTRPLLIRAMMYFALVLHHQKLSLDPILTWFSSAAGLLRSRYVESDRKRAQLHAPTAKPAKGMSVVTNHAEKARDHKMLTTQLYNCALAFALLLRAIQNIMTTVSSEGEAVSFPDLRYLNSAWLSTVLASPVAMDPLVGPEVLKCLQTYLALRNRAMESLKRAEGSQDDFGFEDFDFNDPALNDLIGFAPTPAATSATSDAAEQARHQDSELAKLLKNEVSPALFKLITSIFTPNVTSAESAPKIYQGDLKMGHVVDLIQCWATCASVMVHHKLKAWTSYFRFGEEACSRLSDASARRESSMLLANAIADIEHDAFKTLFDEVVRCWFETVIHPHPTQHHLALTDHVLDTFSTSHALFQNIAGLHLHVDELSEEGITKTFVQARPQLLEEVFRNLAQMLQSQVLDGLEMTNHQQLFTLVGQMITAMRDNLQAFGSLQSQAKPEYEQFCGQVMMALGTASGGQINERTVPALKYLNGLTQIAQ